MQNKKLKHEFVMLAVPADLLLEAGIFEGDSIAVSVESGRLIIENYDEPICDGDCENCPLNDEDCDGDCEDCPCCEVCDESEVD